MSYSCAMALGVSEAASRRFSLKNRNIVITGATGHLGENMIQELVLNSCNILALSRNTNKLLTLSEKHSNLFLNDVDLRDEGQVESAIGNFVNKVGKIRGLVNNAYSATKGVSIEMDKESIMETLDSCFIQYWTTTRVALRYFDELQQGSIVNNGSLFGKVSPNLDMYLDLENEPSIALVSAKGAVHQLTKYLSVILASNNIRVNTLVPGFFPKKRGPERPDYITEITSRLCIKRIGNPEDLIGPLIFLLSDASRYMTGQELVIDGGYLAI